MSKNATLPKVKKKKGGRPRGPTLPPREPQAARVAEALAARGLTIKEGAALIGVSANTLGAWLRDGIRTLYAIQTLKAAGFL